MSAIIQGIPGWLIPSLILFVSVIALTIILERGWTLLRRYSLIDRNEEKELMRFIKAGKFDDAISFCRLRVHPAYAVAAAILEAKDADIDLKAQSEEETMRQVADLEKYLSTLGTISTVAPLLGLLGTVTGMIKSFRAFEQTASRSSELMGGIDEALITTALGLIVAIPALIMYNYFVRRVDTLAQETGILSDMVLDELNG